MARNKRGWGEYAVDLGVRALLAVALALPYRSRVPFMGWVTARIAAPIAGWDTRVRNNLNMILPELPAAEVTRLTRAVPDNFGRALIESYSGEEFIAHLADVPLQGEGVEALAEAHAAGRPVLLVTAHFGNYQAARVALNSRGYNVGGIYMPMSNAYFNERYVAEMKALGGPVFERSARGLARMVKFLKSGGKVGVIADHFMAHGVPIPFLGKPAWTALSAAEMAVKYDALLIPIYGLRQADGLGFDVIVDPPIPHGDPVEMTKAINASLEPMVRAHPDQWFWIHRRWKTPANAPAPA